MVQLMHIRRLLCLCSTLTLMGIKGYLCRGVDWIRFPKELTLLIVECLTPQRIANVMQVMNSGGSEFGIWTPPGPDLQYILQIMVSGSSEF